VTAPHQAGQAEPPAATTAGDASHRGLGEQAPRVALVHDWLTGMRGGEKVLEAIASLYPGAPIFTLFHFPGAVSAALEAHPIHTSFLQRAPALRRRYRHYLPLFPAAIESLDLGGHRLVISTSHCVAKGVIPPPGSFHLCYCHTPMRYAWDQEAAYFPRRHGLVARLRGQILSALRTWDVASAQRVDCFVANSRFVAERIRRYYRREAEVIHPPADVATFVPARERTPAGREGYAVTIAALAPYKRVEVAMMACERAGLDLLVVGDGPERRRLERLAGPRTRLLGRIDTPRLREVLAGARCFVQPGVEDFGIAAVEALACGVPVVARGEGGILDIVEDGRHGVLYDLPAAADVAAEALALAAAIDKSCQITFNTLDLRSRADLFSASRFLDRLRTLLSSAPVCSPSLVPEGRRV
jgi:glycosyltransferase involved in cell wall biosynthesis